jgi:transposase-like protein/IS1 family transposase
MDNETKAAKTMTCETCNVDCQRFGKHRNGLQRFRCPKCRKTYTEDHARLLGTMTVPEDKAILAIQLLIEGASIRSTERITGMHRDTIMRVLVLAGQRCYELMDAKMRELNCTRIQADEIWTFVGKKNKRVQLEESSEVGDQWVFVAIDADTKLVPCFAVGKRTVGTTYGFIRDLAARLKYRPQLTTDGFGPYRNAVEDSFGEQVDFAQLIKVFSNAAPTQGRYSPSPLVEVISKIRQGRPDPKHISTSYVERQNLTMRMAIRRFTRLTNAFSKKLENLRAACALHFAYYNFCRVHQTLRCTPAMQAGITDHIWTIAELIAAA